MTFVSRNQPWNYPMSETVLYTLLYLKDQLVIRCLKGALLFLELVHEQPD